VSRAPLCPKSPANGYARELPIRQARTKGCDRQDAKEAGSHPMGAVTLQVVSSLCGTADGSLMGHCEEPGA